MVVRLRRNVLLGVVVAVAWLVTACEPVRGHFSAGVAGDSDLPTLLALAEQSSVASSSVVVDEQIVRAFLTLGHSERAQVYLARRIEQQPPPEYAAYYLYLMAQTHVEAGNRAIAITYLSRAVRHHQDVLLQGRSVHRMALEQLAAYETRPEFKIDYLTQLADRFAPDIDLGPLYYHIARTYQELGEWSQAQYHYRLFLRYPDSVIPERPNAFAEVQALIAFWDSTQDWTVPTLEELVRRIRSAVSRQSARDLLRLRAKRGFFSMSWEQEEADHNSRIVFEVDVFLVRSPRIAIAPALDPRSNSREAFLRTSGWSHRIPTWYLYFRKIDFPANPEINGSWEWAGIFFGEPL